MAEYTATVSWTRSGASFLDKRYSRVHEWRFDGGTTVPASASPHVVPAPMSDPRGVDPEEAFVASLASCHMLNFLFLAAKAGFVVDSYTDAAAGQMEKNPEGRLAITRVTLQPQVRFSGGRLPAAEELQKLHDQAHHDCFIANSVRTVVTVIPLS
jgi:organic hydroperoxide reductase OsmC/OhrA